MGVFDGVFDVAWPMDGGMKAWRHGQWIEARMEVWMKTWIEA